ncbi:gamma-glutamyl-gamma-aminobutyrate hydrolase family protein [Saccharospirillum salsuginis]|uniref:gamma-glutamyl-gamma-aminobutyrate hydrolase n=1 Tax=Saccharospirillum salsuginis TaxID=418750 RepID=A0A918NIP0_9GAMM|nr:gamma-glutamyl-gamma-aminobutyrate hydrolase family protein [Saccharospirillum salsuginis]GGX76152.1 gamma-glutamyl-gamma-aminobutyrate hydrolase [Saccharospirillum salsuginis]
MSATDARPWVGVVCDVQQVPPHAFHMAGDKYLRALAEAAGVTPVLLPALTDLFDAAVYLDRLDGLFLTGGYSMVHPSLYNETPVDDPSFDRARDALSLRLIDAALTRDLPLFAACRGFQEVNVALGGRLHQALHRVDGLQEHREDKSLSLDQQYAPAHEVSLEEGGLLQRLLKRSSLSVNSLHVQGIQTLGEGLAVEARAPDGLIEAFRIEALTFGLAVQWHPEWQVSNHPHQHTLFEAFGDACRA